MSLRSLRTQAWASGPPGLNLPGVDLNNVQPAQAAQVAGASLDLPDQQRGVVEDIALNAAQKNPE